MSLFFRWKKRRDKVGFGLTDSVVGKVYKFWHEPNLTYLIKYAKLILTYIILYSYFDTTQTWHLIVGIGAIAVATCNCNRKSLCFLFLFLVLTH